MRPLHPCLTLLSPALPFAASPHPPRRTEIIVANTPVPNPPPPGVLPNNGVPRLQYVVRDPAAANPASNGEFLNAALLGIPKFRLPSDMVSACSLLELPGHSVLSALRQHSC